MDKTVLWADSWIMLIVIHAVVTWALVGLIWTIQWVHYPLLAEIGADRFRSYHRRHLQRMSTLVGPLVSVEFASALLVTITRPNQWLGWIGLVLCVGNAAVTALIHAPLHLRLAAGYDAPAIERLARLNWWRTAFWTLRGMVAALLVHSTGSTR